MFGFVGVDDDADVDAALTLCDPFFFSVVGRK